MLVLCRSSGGTVGIENSFVSKNASGGLTAKASSAAVAVQLKQVYRKKNGSLLKCLGAMLLTSE